MTDMIPFAYDGTPLRTVLIDGEPWFVLADLCCHLDLSSPHKVYERVAEDAKGRSPIPTPGGAQEMAVVSEAGMYEVVIRSDKPNAVTFRRWITGTVLPKIRRTGSYGQHNAQVIPQGYAEALRAAADQYERAEMAEARVAELVPAAAAWTELAAADGDLGVADAAKVLYRAGIDTGQRRLFTFMESINWIYRDSQNRWCAYQSAVDAGQLVEKVSGTHPDPYTGREVLNHPTIRVTAKGLEGLHQKMSPSRELVSVGPSDG